MVFLRPDGAGDFGHVGFGYRLPNGAWIVGGLEGNGNFHASAADGANFWCRQVPDARAAMVAPTHFGAPAGTPAYVNAKVIDVATPQPDAAEASINQWSNRDYWATGGNCMNCTYDVLTAYGAHLLDPSSNPALWTPNDWFNNLAGTLAPA